MAPILYHLCFLCGVIMLMAVAGIFENPLQQHAKSSVFITKHQPTLTPKILSTANRIQDAHLLPSGAGADTYNKLGTHHGISSISGSKAQMYTFQWGRCTLAAGGLLSVVLGTLLWRKVSQTDSHQGGEVMAMAAWASQSSPIARVPQPPHFFTLGQPLSRTPTSLALTSYATDETFATDVLQSPVPVLLCFTANWCGPCNVMEPIIEELSSEYDGRLKVVKVNVDDSSKVSSEYGVRSVPTFMLFKGGMKKETILGVVPKKYIISTLTPHVP